MIDATTLKYGVACAAVLAFTGLNRSVSRHAFWFAVALSLSCLLTNLLNLNLYYPEALAPYPLIDLAAGVFVAITIWGRPRVWEVLLSTTFLIQCARHATFWSGQAHGQGYEAVAPYMDNLSDILTIQLVLCCVPGGLHVCGRLYSMGSRALMRLLSRPRGRLGHRNEDWKS